MRARVRTRTVANGGVVTNQKAQLATANRSSDTEGEWTIGNNQLRQIGSLLGTKLRLQGRQGCTGVSDVWCSVPTAVVGPQIRRELAPSFEKGHPP